MWRFYLGAGALATGGYDLLSDGGGAPRRTHPAPVGALLRPGAGPPAGARQPGRGGRLEHAQAKRLWLELEGQGDRVHRCIRDDGVGFDLPSAAYT